MGEYLQKTFGQIGEFLKTLSPVKKAAMGITSVVIVVGMIGLFYWAGDTTYQVLVAAGAPEEVANIIGILREKHIPFKVDPTGKIVSVPTETLLELRMQLASLGMAQSNIVGNEIFDKVSLGTTSFVQKVNQKRALEGEITRTIGSIKGVRRSRVHLALPQKSTFIEDQKKSTASVVLDLDPGVVLSEKQVFGIGNLVSRAVEGLDQSDVVIVDSQGKVLSHNSSDPVAAATANQLDFKQKVEQDMEHRVEAMLSRIVGDGHVVARVSADLDFSQVNETQTTYDADGSAVKSVQKDNKAMEGSRPGPYGLAGATSNTPGQPPVANNQVKSDTKTSNEVTNYEVPQTIRRTTRASGGIKRLSVAVVVDGKQVKTTGKDSIVQSKSEAWSPEKLKEFEDIVSSAVGIDKKRGDILEVKNMEFTHEDFEEAQRLINETERKSYIQTMVIYSVVGLTILLFFMFVVRPFIKWITENTSDSVDTFLPQTIEELERLQKNSLLPGLEEAVPVLPEKIDPEKIEGEMIKEKITTLVDANPHKAALILRDWLHDTKKAAEKAAEAAEAEKDGRGGPGGKSKSA